MRMRNDGSIRLNLIFSPEVYDKLNAFRKERLSSLTELIRLALGLLDVAMTESRAGNKLLVVTPDNKAAKELVLPPPRRTEIANDFKTRLRRHRSRMESGRYDWDARIHPGKSRMFVY